MLSAWRNFDDGVSFESRYLDFPSEYSRDQIDRDITGNVESFTLKDLMRLDGNGHIEIPGGAAVRAMLSFIGEAEPHSGFNSSWDVDGDRTFFVHPLASLAGRAGFRDEVSGAFALPAGTAHTEEPLLKTNLPRAFAAGARLDGRRRFCSGAFAIGTEFPTRNLEFGFFPVYRFLERNFKIVLQVVTAFSSTASPGSGLTKEVFEDVVEDVAKSASAKVKPVKTRATLLASGVAEHVVAFPLLLIAQGFVGFIDFFELFFSGLLLLFACMQVGVMLAG